MDLRKKNVYEVYAVDKTRAFIGFVIMSSWVVIATCSLLWSRRRPRCCFSDPNKWSVACYSYYSAAAYEKKKYTAWLTHKLHVGGALHIEKCLYVGKMVPSCRVSCLGVHSDHEDNTQLMWREGRISFPSPTVSTICFKWAPSIEHASGVTNPHVACTNIAWTWHVWWTRAALTVV
jgi:hypothetical protein